jgi:hypothetical protein
MDRRSRVKRVTMTLTAPELELLGSLAEDQLFRREFIDPKMPGYRPNGAELQLAKQLVERLRQLRNEAAGISGGQRGRA